MDMVTMSQMSNSAISVGGFKDSLGVTALVVLILMVMEHPTRPTLGPLENGT